MIVTSITVQGQTGKQATVSMDQNEIVICAGSAPTFRISKWTDEDTIYSHAATMQQELDGFEGTEGDIHDYVRLLQQFTA